MSDAITEIEELRANAERDPRYWKHQDPEIVERVRNGFRRLYDEKK